MSATAVTSAAAARVAGDGPPLIRAEGIWKISAGTPSGSSGLEGGSSAPRAAAKTGCVVAVRDVSIEVWPGEVFVVMGLSGRASRRSCAR